jgi:hypothetical protein
MSGNTRAGIDPSAPLNKRSAVTTWPVRYNGTVATMVSTDWNVIMTNEEIDELGVKLNALLADAVVLFDQIETIAKPNLFFLVERNKTDYRAEFLAEARSGEPLNPVTSTRILDLADLEIRYYLRITVGRGINSGRAAFVEEEHQFELLTAQGALKILSARVDALRADVACWSHAY